MGEMPDELWNDLCTQYLSQVEHALRRVAHPRTSELIEDLKNHLAQRYMDLPPEDRTPETLRGIIAQMETPTEYAGILSGDNGREALLPSIWRNPWARRAVITTFGLSLLLLILLWPSTCLPYLAVASYAVLVVALIVRYIGTRDVGFVWLGVAIVVWPVVARLTFRFGLRPIIDRLSAGGGVGFYPFTLVERGTVTLGSLLMIISDLALLAGQGLLLLAIVKLCRPHRTDDVGCVSHTKTPSG